MNKEVGLDPVSGNYSLNKRVNYKGRLIKPKHLLKEVVKKMPDVHMRVGERSKVVPKKLVEERILDLYKEGGFAKVDEWFENMGKSEKKELEVVK